MRTINFDERDLYAMVPDPANHGAWIRTQLRWRQDPLTGASARILSGLKLQPLTRPNLSGLAAPPSFCPFDIENLESTTFSFPPEIMPEGRIRRGHAVVIPNIMAYATHSAVGIYDPARHFLNLEDFSQSLVGDALTAMVAHARAIRRVDSTATWSSISANHLPPSGASLIHAHLQSAHDACGLTNQRALVDLSGAWAEKGDSYWSALIEQEDGGPRWVGRTGRISWLTPFAPSGFYEVWGVVEGAADLIELTDADCQMLGLGISKVLDAYRAWNLASFNFGIIGGGPSGRHSGYQLLVKIISRSNPEPMYRSDVTYFERIYGEALVDVSPEEVASGVREVF